MPIINPRIAPDMLFITPRNGIMEMKSYILSNATKIMNIRRANRMNRNKKQATRPILSRPPKKGLTKENSRRYVKLAAIKPTTRPTSDPRDFIKPKLKHLQVKPTINNISIRSSQFIKLFNKSGGFNSSRFYYIISMDFFYLVAPE